MRKQVLAVTIGVLLVLSVFSVLNWQIKPVEATEIFNNGFEEGQFNPSPGVWTSNSTSGSGAITIVTSWAKEGTHSAQIAGSSDSDIADISKSFTTASTVSVRWYFNASTCGLTGTKYEAIAYMTGSGGWNTWFLRLVGDPHVLRFVYNNNSDSLQTKTSTTALTANTVYCIEVKMIKHASTGEYRVYLDDVEVSDLTTTGMATDSVVVDRIYFGNTAAKDGSSFTYLYDSIVVANTYIGMAGSDSTAPTFGTVNANTTLAGNGTQLSCLITDNVAVSAWGFAWNNTGATVNATKILVSVSTPYTALFKGTWNTTSGNVVWVQFWSNDSTNNEAYSTQTFFTLTTQGGFVLPTDNWNYGYCGWNISDVTVANIQSAISEAITYSGGHAVNVTVMIAQGDWNINETTSGTFQISLSGLATNTWLNIIGSETNTTDSTNYVGSITMPSVILRGTNSSTTTCSMFQVTGAANKHIRFCGLSILGTAYDSASGEQVGIKVTNVDGYRIDHCYIDSHSGADILTYKSKGLIDHTVIDQTYGGPSWGYGIQIAGNFAYDGIWGNLDNMAGLWDFTGGYTYHYGPNYAEDCEFYRCRHAITTSQFGYIVLRHCYFSEPLSQGLQYIDQHGAIYTSGRCIEFYNNSIYDVGQSYDLRGGSGLVFNNTFTDISYNAIILANEPYSGREEQDTNDVWIWDNIYNSVGNEILNQDPSDIVLNDNYTLSARPSYTAYMYPHPWVGSSPEVVIITVTYPSNTTYYDPTISVQFSATGGTIDKQWFNCKNGSSWIYVSNQTYTTPTTMTGFVTGTQYTGYFWANNTVGTVGVAMVMFSVSVNAGGTSQVIVNVWWSGWW